MLQMGFGPSVTAIARDRAQVHVSQLAAITIGELCAAAMARQTLVIDNPVEVDRTLRRIARRQIPAVALKEGGGRFKEIRSELHQIAVPHHARTDLVSN